MRHMCSIESILIINKTCAPTKVGINSWVTLHSGRNGEHARDAQKHKEEGGYKVKILKFRMKKGSRSITEVLVQHAYTHRQLQLELGVHHEACNSTFSYIFVENFVEELYLSNSEDLVDPKSILDVIYVIHANIGEAQRGSQSHKDLLQIGVYFYSAQYYPPTRNGYGRLQHLPLPGFQDPEWPIPDMGTSEAYRTKFRCDIQTTMKPNLSSRLTHVNWFLPTHVMVDLFTSTAMRRTPTLFVFKNLTRENLDSLMDPGWDSKVCIGADIVRCIVDRTTVIFCYHIGRSTLYMNFQYNRQRLIQGIEWEFLGQVHQSKMVKILGEVVGCEEPLELEVGSNWTLASLRQEILIALGSDVEDGFGMCITEGGVVREKINVRNEKRKTVADIQPPKVLRIIPESRM